MDAVAAQLPRADMTMNSGIVAPERITLSTLIHAYLNAYAGRDKSRYARALWWRDVLGASVVIEISDSDVFQALKTYAGAPSRVYAGRDAEGKRIYRKKGNAPAAGSINRRKAALSAVIRWGQDERLLPSTLVNPTRSIRRQREPKGRVRFLTEAERAKLLDATKASKWKRLYLLVLMAIATGARRGELGRLTWGDIDFERHVAYVRVSKNDEPRVLPLTPAVLAELARFRSKRLERLVFASRVKPRQPYNTEGPWRQALKDAALSDFKFHDLRHTCASYLAQSGASILEIADVLGHKDLKMTQRYAHLTVSSKAAVIQRVLGEIR